MHNIEYAITKNKQIIINRVHVCIINVSIYVCIFLNIGPCMNYLL